LVEGSFICFFMSKLRIALLLLTCHSFFLSHAQKPIRVEPPNWWAGMRNTELQLMVYGDNIAKSNVDVSYPGVEVISIVSVENPNYLFINLNVGNANPGIFEIVFYKNDEKIAVYNYHLLERINGSSERNGFDASDVIYLLYPDRFANGNPNNDEVSEMIEGANRTDMHGRHGGDLQGILNHLDYFNDLGVTTLWLNPVLENNQPSWSYHGYAITDFYRVDPRFGDNELYRIFVEKAHLKGLKVIKDLVFNHSGRGHWWIDDLPMNDWLNQWDNYTQSNYRQLISFDPHASQRDINLMTKGWFDWQMPDLNQKNPFVAKYLIQNSIWWAEYANLNGFRMDTHPYCDKHFMAQWCNAIMQEYPHFSIVGETWFNHPLWVSYWQMDAINPDGYNSNLPIVMDFPLMNAIQKAFDEEDGWETGLARLYEVLAHDFTYPNWNNLLVFIDNHDKGRFHRDSSLEISRMKLALTFLLTTRGIPQIYYGTEFLLPGDDANGHGDIRRDFPGGWADDQKSAFTSQGRTDRENEIWNYTSKLLHWRKNASAVHIGGLTHFNPENGVYVYFRYDNQQTVMVLINNSHETREILGSGYNEFLAKFSRGVDVITGNRIDILNKFHILPRSAMVIELF